MWLGSLCPSIKTPMRRALRLVIRASRSAWGTLRAADGSRLVICSFRIANNWVWLSKSKRFREETPPIVALGSNCLTQAWKSSGTILPPTPTPRSRRKPSSHRKENERTFCARLPPWGSKRTSRTTVPRSTALLTCSAQCAALWRRRD